MKCFRYKENTLDRIKTWSRTAACFSIIAYSIHSGARNSASTFSAEQLTSHTRCTINIIHTPNILLKIRCHSIFTREAKCFSKFSCLRTFPAITPERWWSPVRHTQYINQGLEPRHGNCSVFVGGHHSMLAASSTDLQDSSPFTRMNVHYMTVFPNTERLKWISVRKCDGKTEAGS